MGHLISRVLAAGIAMAGAAGQAQATQSVVVTWNDAALTEVRNSKLGPPVVARALAVAHACIYDAWAPYDSRALGLESSVPRRPAAENTDANKAKAVSFAAYRCLLNLFPAGAGRLHAAMAQLGYDANDTSTNLATPQGIGNAVAAAVIAARRNDGSNQYGDLAAGAYADYTGYAPRNAPMPFCQPATPGTCTLNITDPLHWQPLVANNGTVQSFVAPHWERVDPFALSSATQFDTLPEVAPGPRYLQSAALYQSDVDQMVSVSGALTQQQKLIVEYWADGPSSELPPGHWGLLAQYVARRDFGTGSLDRDVKMFFAMHGALHDAGIAAWHLKRKYDGVRPITAVRLNKQGQTIFAWGGPGKPNAFIDGGKWSPYNPGSNLTPSFPGWVSGHSTFSSAAATVLRSFTGSDNLGYTTTIPPNFGRVEPGVPAGPTQLSYATFSAAVSDAGLSRIYAGIHFNDDNTVGQALGNQVGQQAWRFSQYMFEGGLLAGAGSRTASSFANGLSWSHTVPSNNNRLLVVGVATNSNIAVNGVSYAGQPLQRLGTQTDWAGDNRIELWYRVAPPVGTATVSVQMAWFGDVVAGASNYHGVHQGTPFGTLRAANNESTSACVTLANEAAPLVVSLVAANGDAGGLAPTGSLAGQWSGLSDTLVTGASDVYGSAAAGPAAPVASVCQRLTYARRWAALAVPLKPAFAR